MAQGCDRRRNNKLFCDVSRVKFFKLDKNEIEKYVDEFKPFDKAGSYGVQDGVTVEKVKGSYDNVMGLPTEKLRKNKIWCKHHRNRI